MGAAGTERSAESDNPQQKSNRSGSLARAGRVGNRCRTPAERYRVVRGRLAVWDLTVDPAEEHPSTVAPAHLVRCLDETRARVGKGVGGDVHALRALGYVE